MLRRLGSTLCGALFLATGATSPTQQRLGSHGSSAMQLSPEDDGSDSREAGNAWSLAGEADVAAPSGLGAPFGLAMTLFNPHSLGLVAKSKNVTIPLFPDEWNAGINDMATHINLHVLLVPVVIGFAFLFLIVASLVTASRWKREERSRDSWTPSHGGLSARSLSLPDESPVAEPRPPPTLHEWSVLGIIALTSYRFYTGFLSATWMPYLLAMEGHQLMGQRQSFFMGSAKLIYGMSIMMNPMFGLVGDQVAVVSHWSGRRLFILVGVGAGGLGIYGCLMAAQIHSVWWYLLATVLWMLGEAMADVTTETLVPELLPRSQYEISSALRALNFLLGGLAGYGALIALRDFHYSWLYYGYLMVMMVCAFLTLCFINTDDLGTARLPKRRKDTPLCTLLTQAYYLPGQIEGGFPTACLCLFVFSLGSAPMFFLLLMVRDVIGIQEHVSLQMHFSIISIVFFVSAAMATVLGYLWAAVVNALGMAAAEGEGASASSADQAAGSREVSQQMTGPEAGAGSAPATEEASKTISREAVVSRWRLMVLSTVLFGAVAAAIPLVGLLPTVGSRTACFYVVASLFGLSFGVVYARFQECTWSLLPTGVDVANAMGFAAMCKLAGVGIGNFLAGIILDCFSKGSDASYSLGGYIVMCLCCAGVVLLSGYLAHGVSKVALADYDRGVFSES